METKKHNIIVIIASVIIAVIISFVQWQTHHTKKFTSNTYFGSNGWGYDILVNNKLFIHQELIPTIQTKRAFPEKEQAEQVAALVIQKLKSGHSPTLTLSELQRILPANENVNEGERKNK